MAVKSWRTWDFKKMQSTLPNEVQEVANKNFAIWKENPLHPSLHFKPVSGGLWSVRIGKGYRAIGRPKLDGTMVWTWIGHHKTYDKTIKR